MQSREEEELSDHRYHQLFNLSPLSHRNGQPYFDDDHIFRHFPFPEIKIDDEDMDNQHNEHVNLINDVADHKIQEQPIKIQIINKKPILVQKFQEEILIYHSSCDQQMEQKIEQEASKLSEKRTRKKRKAKYIQQDEDSYNNVQNIEEVIMTQNLKNVTKTAYKIIIEKTIIDFNSLFELTVNEFKGKQPARIRRRMYDALNVLKSAGIIQGDRKNIILNPKHRPIPKKIDTQIKIQQLKIQIEEKRKQIETLKTRKIDGGMILKGLKKFHQDKCHKAFVPTSENIIRFPMIILSGEDVQHIQRKGQNISIQLGKDKKLCINQDVQAMHFAYSMKLNENRKHNEINNRNQQRT